MTNSRKKVVFLCDEIIMPWAQRDIDFLKKHFEVSILHRKPSFIKLLSNNRWKFLRVIDYSFCRISDFLRLSKLILGSDIIFGWFATEFTVFGIILSKLYRKKSIVVVGGYDIENMPEIEYGMMQYKNHRRFILFGLKYADLIIPFSEYATNTIKKLVTNHNNIHQINLGCDTNRFSPKGLKQPIVITVGFIDEVYIKRKGFDTFIKAAEYLPEVDFYVIGKQRDEAAKKLKVNSPNNVHFTGFVSDDDLLSFYQKAKIFCLLSYQEGQGGGGVLGEAMACGCIPIVTTNALALKETVGKLGLYVDYGDGKSTAECIKLALNCPNETSELIREQIIKNYPLKKRDDELLKYITNVLSK